jgi:hypothetical protein
MSRARDTADQINRVNSSAADATAITVTSLEKIGIGTDAPTGKLTVRSSVGGGEALTVSSSNSGGNYVTHKHYTASGDIAYTGAGGGAAVSAGSSNDYAIRANLGSLIFATGGNNERARLDSDGLKFHGDTAAANALNDYEEGTWTPTLHDNVGGSISLGSATYTKIGRIVQVKINSYNNSNFSTLNVSGALRITGFPFAGAGGAVPFGTNNPNNVNLLLDISGTMSWLWIGNGAIDFSFGNKGSIGLGTGTASMRGTVTYQAS